MIDFFIFIILLIFLIFGFVRGFQKEIKSIIALFIFVVLSFKYADFIGNYCINYFQINNAYIPSYLYSILGGIILYIFVSFIVYIFGKILFDSSTLFNNIFFTKTLGSFISLIKAVFLISILILLVQYYGYFDFFVDFTENSLFLDYFLKFGVQLQYVWNHWYS